MIERSTSERPSLPSAMDAADRASTASILQASWVVSKSSETSLKSSGFRYVSESGPNATLRPPKASASRPNSPAGSMMTTSSSG